MNNYYELTLANGKQYYVAINLSIVVLEEFLAFRLPAVIKVSKITKKKYNENLDKIVLV